MNFLLFLTRLNKLFHVFGSTRLIEVLLRHRVLAGAEHRNILKREITLVVDVGANRGQFAIAVRRWIPNGVSAAFTI